MIGSHRSNKGSGPDTQLHCTPQVSGRSTTETALREFIASTSSTFDVSLCNVMTSDDPEGPHQARVALRQLRVVLSGFAPLIDKRVLIAQKAEARHLFRLIGRLRDTDVIAEAQTDQSNRATNAAEMARLRTELRALRSDTVNRSRTWSIRRVSAAHSSSGAASVPSIDLRPFRHTACASDNTSVQQHLSVGSRRDRTGTVTSAHQPIVTSRQSLLDLVVDLPFSALRFLNIVVDQFNWGVQVTPPLPGRAAQSCIDPHRPADPLAPQQPKPATKSATLP